MSISKKMLTTLCGMGVMFFCLTIGKNEAYADTASDCLKTESIGASIVFNTNAYNDAATDNLGIELPQVEEIEASNLVMVKSTSVLNVRAESSLEGELLGKLYRDCGGIVLEIGEEWSYIESGDLQGWCLNEYLLFGDEAVEFAKEVGTMYATINKSCASIYEEASGESQVKGYASLGSTYEVIYEVDEDWVCIACENYDGFVRREELDVEFDIDHGETMEAIKARKAKEEEEKRKLIRRNEAIQADADTLKMLATIIWCEARGESYDGQLAVGSVVMNRVRSGAYPNDVFSVIFASGQFSPVRSGTFQRAYENNSANQSCINAATEVLNGYTNIGDMTHFRRAGNRQGYIIGHHVFY